MLSQLEKFNALVIGSSGSIGQAFIEHLNSLPNCSKVIGLNRQSTPSIDYANPSSIQEAADALSHEGPFHLIIVATGILHNDAWLPEK
jgi:dTDP-4-dehydrorhamnose reductase